jgi:RNA-binding protein Nova
LSIAALDSASGTAPIGGSSSEEFLFKILCPQPFVGRVIGKGGATINQMISVSGAKIDMSKNGEYFPESMDRVILRKFFSVDID